MNAAAANFVVHSLAHLRAALTAGTVSGRAIIALSAPGVTGFAGAGWFLALVRQGKSEFPEIPFIAILDCGDRAGDALTALSYGADHLIFTGHPEALARLRAIAEESGATILDQRPPALDLLDVKDIDYATAIWCAKAAI